MTKMPTIPNTLVTSAHKPAFEYPNSSTRKTLSVMQEFLDEEFPVDRGSVYQDEAAREKTLADNKRLHAAFERYKEVVSRPNPVFEYISRNLDKGFTPEEWMIFATGLGFRVLPTLSVLEMQDAFSRAGNFHHSAIKHNLKDEAGIGERSHIALYFDFIRTLQETFTKEKTGKDVQFMDDMGIFGILSMVLKFRKEGKPFKTWEEFTNSMVAEGFIAPHNVHHLGAADIKEDKLVEKVLTVLNPHGPVNRKSTVEGLGSAHYYHAETKFSAKLVAAQAQAEELPWFNKALKLAELIPDSLLNYGESTYKNQHAIMAPENRYKLWPQLANALMLLTREQNADQGSHIHASLKLVRSHAGYVTDPRYEEMFKKWSSDHVGEQQLDGKQGVEEDHANDARQWFMMLARAGRGPIMGRDKQISTEDYIKAFDFVVERDYPPLQQAHMQAMVDAMQKCRDKAIAEAKPGENRFIQPRSEVEKIRIMDVLRGRTKSSAVSAR